VLKLRKGLAGGATCWTSRMMPRHHADSITAAEATTQRRISSS
jgi:hypothetical protein